MKSISPLFLSALISLAGIGEVMAQADLLSPPVANPPSPYTFVDEMEVVLSIASDTGPRGEIRFDTSDTDPTYAEVYTGPIKLTRSKVIHAIAYYPNGTSEGVSFTYTRNVRPSVSITFPADGQVLRSGSNYSLTASASDPEGTPLRVTYQYSEGGGWVDIGFSNAGPAYTVPWIPSAPSAYTLRAVARDGANAEGVSSSVGVTVTAPNQAPVATLTFPANGASYVLGAPVSLAATASDPDFGGGITRVEFFNLAGRIASDAQAPYTATFTPTAAGVDTLWAVAYDNHGTPLSGTSARVGIVINPPPPPNGRPVVNSLVATPGGPFTAPAAFSLTATASDSDGTVAYVQFYRGGTFMLRDSGAPFTYAVTNLAAGSHAFTARAFDDDGDSSAVSSTVTVVVSANQAPTASTGRDTAILVQPANTISLNGSGSSDPENGTNLLYSWTAPAGVTLANAATATPTATINSTGEYPITLTVTDRGNPPLSDSHVIRVSVYSRPSITSRLVDTLNAGSPYSYLMTATGFPTPGFSVGARPAWLNVAGNTLSGTAPATGGPATVTFTAANAAGSETRTLNLFIRQAPRITRDLPDSLVMQEGWFLVMSVEAAGSPAPTYQWQIVQANGSTVNIGGNSPSHTINSLSLSHSGTYRVIVSNGVNPQATSRHMRLIVKQAILITSQPKGVSAQVGRNATLQVRATGSPPLYYQWFRGNTALGAANVRDSNLVIPSVALSDAGLYRVRVTNPWTNDTVGSTFKVSDTARITVTLPKIDRPKTTPAAPFDYGRDGPSLTVRVYTDTPYTYIRYTTDGTNPTATYGTVYDTARKVVLTRTSAILKVMAYRDNYQPSDMFTGNFNYVEPSRAAKPTAWPMEGLFGPDPQLCSLRTSTPGGVIRYTVNGQDPRTSPHAIYTGPFLLTSNTTVTAYAAASGFTDSDTLVKVYTLRRIVQTAQSPLAVPPAAAFTDSVKVALSSATDSATIFYTLDGSAPETSPTRQTYTGAAIVLRQSAVLLAVATRPDWNSSPVTAHTYSRIPGPIAATPAPRIFEGQITVSLSATPADARIYYTLNDSIPLDDRKQPIDQAVLYGGPFVLDSTRTVTAIAMQDTVISRVFRFAYTRMGGPLNTPVVSTGDRPYSFRDTLRVTLRGVQNETIRYTLNGTPPNASSPAYASPLLIDTTTTLQAIAYQDAFQPSKVLVATFTLVADTPSANPPGGDYGSTRQVILTAASRKTPIRYTVDGSLPGPDQGILYRPGEVITISKPTMLRAVAFAGGVPGPMRSETYNIFGARDTLLGPGQTFFLEGGYTITNPVDQGVSVRVRQGSADSLSLPGFKDVQFSLILSPSPTEAPVMPAEFPNLVLARSISDNRGVYRVTPEGRIYYVSGARMVSLGEAGTYFMGTDTATPIITYLGETQDDTGATLVRFKVEDNVFNLLHNAKRSDNPLANVSDGQVFSGSGLEFRLKHPAGSLKALTLQLSATDYRNVAFCPPGGQSFLPLSQKLTNIQGPDIWRVGLDRVKPYDLVGIPVQLNPPLTVADLGDPKTGVRVEAYVFVNPAGAAGAGTWRRLGQAEALVPGQAYWLGSRSRVKGFKRASAITAAQGLRKFTVALRHGWNQVANPHLEPLYWPFPRHLDTLYISSLVKGLWAYAPESPAKYLERDVLEPWQGYFVYNHGRDTLIELSSRPLAKPARWQEGTVSPFRASLSLTFGDAPAVRLGATLETRDALGHEDEGALPALEAQYALRAVREGRGLSVDLIRFEPDRILQWRILPRLSPGSAPAAGNLPAVKVLARGLPEGYEAWGISRARAMKFKLSEGDSLPVSGLPDDTLIVAAGPAAKLAEWDLLKRLAEEAPSLDLRVGSRAGVPEFRLDLPAAARISATVWSLRGTSLGALDRNLAAGRYRFTFADFRGGQPQPAPGVHFLRVEIRSQGRIMHLARKIVFRP